ncbi:MAG: hypothetical protein U0R51_07210 [Solirubrobacterales bacterium]
MTGASDETEDDEGGDAGAEPGRPERPRLRRSPLGYRRADVDAALEKRDDELTELRQDVAALWLAFAQHDRVLRALSEGAVAPPSAPQIPEPEREVSPAAEIEPGPDQAEIAAEAASIGEQLSELDDVLAAIEMATQTLERTYADEIRGAGRGGSSEAPAKPGEGEEPPAS